MQRLKTAVSELSSEFGHFVKHWQPVYKQHGLKSDAVQATEGSNDDTHKQQAYVLFFLHYFSHYWQDISLPH